MADATLHLTPAQQQRLTLGHSLDGTSASSWEFDVMAPAGGFRSTTVNLLTFLQANLSAVDASLGVTFARAQERYFEVGDTFSIGLAWHSSMLQNGQVVHWHNGGTGGYVSFIGFDKAKQTGVVILSNYGDVWVNDYSVDEMALSLLMEVG